MTATAIGTYATTAALKARIGISDSNDDTQLGLVCDQINQDIETYTQQPIAPISSATYLYDSEDFTRIYLPAPVNASTKGIGGARAITLLEIAPYTAGTFETLTSTDYMLRSRVTVGGPYRWLILSNLPTGSYSHFRDGIGNVRITMTAGWAAIPDDVIEIALNAAQRAWNARQAGQQVVSGSDEMGRPWLGNSLTKQDRMMLLPYKLRPAV